MTRARCRVPSWRRVPGRSAPGCPRWRPVAPTADPADPPADRWAPWSNRSSWPAAPPRRGWSSVPTRPTSAGTVASASGMSPTTRERAVGGAGIDRHRDGLGPPVRLALRAGTPGRPVRSGLDGGRRRLPSGRAPWCWPAWATPAARDPAPTPSRSCGRRRGWPTPSTARCRWRWSRRRSSELVVGFAAAPPGWRSPPASAGSRWTLGPLLAAPPVPLRAHQPTAPTPTGTTGSGSPRRWSAAVPAGAGPRRCGGRPPLLRRAGPLGRRHPRAGRRTGRPAGRRRRPGGGGPGRALLRLGLPARRPHRRRLQRRPLPDHAPAAGGRTAVALQGSVVDPVHRPVGPRRRGGRPGGDDPGPDRRPRPGAAGPRRSAGPGPALHPLQPGLPGPRQPEPAGQLRGRAPQRPRDGGAPRRGHRRRPRRRVLVVGGGVAGLECARVLATRGHRVRVHERDDAFGGATAAAAVGPGRERMARLADWLEAECRTLGVELDPGAAVTAGDLDEWAAHARAGGAGHRVASVCPSPCRSTGTPWSWTPRRSWPAVTPPSPTGRWWSTTRSAVRWGSGVAEWLAAGGHQVALVTQDPVAGTLLSLTGDLADANTRLQRAGVRRELRARLRGIDRRVGRPRGRVDRRAPPVACAALVDCSHRLPEDVPGRRPARPPAGRRLRGSPHHPPRRPGGTTPGTGGGSARRRVPAAWGPEPGRTRGPPPRAPEPPGDRPGGGPGRPGHRGGQGHGPEPRGPPGRRGRRRARRRHLRRHPRGRLPAGHPGRARGDGTPGGGGGWAGGHRGGRRPRRRGADPGRRRRGGSGWAGSTWWWPTPGSAPSSRGTRSARRCGTPSSPPTSPGSGTRAWPAPPT